ncbi:flagellar export protein FliJ [Oleiharenicola lentus]|jgi:flagellar FliJ protein|uniref:Flagellar FliJ protein n=1 Tax=Oleiharenicola lentus TaxID=2508720 RepID=A0A4Q1C3P4_9BACT|nr:flagellar export protein FliJ [Oleiharenicola lentus]RXK52967.1 flagellar export protein FliJ [Oleiharenicola lentus]
MKKFRFPLQPVGVLRNHQEQRAREVFAAAVHRYVQSEEKLAALRKRAAELAEVLFHGRSGQFLAAEAAALLRVYRGECQSVMEAEREVIEAREDMNKRRAEYIEANRRLKIVTKLEEKAREKHRLAVLRAGQEELDELAGFRAFRQPALS